MIGKACFSATQARYNEVFSIRTSSLRFDAKGPSNPTFRRKVLRLPIYSYIIDGWTRRKLTQVKGQALKRASRVMCELVADRVALTGLRRRGLGSCISRLEFPIRSKYLRNVDANSGQPCRDKRL